MLGEDLSVFLNDFGIIVTKANSQTFKAILDQPDETISSLAISTEYALTAKTSDVADLEMGAELMIDLQTFTIRTKHKISDGSFSSLILSKETP